MKRRVVIIAVLITVAVLSTVLWFTSSRGSGNEAELLQIANIVSELQHSPDVMIGDLSDASKSLISEYRDELLSLNTAVIDLTALFPEDNIDYDASSAMESGPDSEYGSEPELNLPGKTSENDERSYTDSDGHVKIRVDDLHQMQDGSYYALYNGDYCIIPTSIIPITYKIMQNSPKYVYTLDRYEWAKDKSYLAVRYISVYDGSQMIVRVYTDGKQATKIEVR